MDVFCIDASLQSYPEHLQNAKGTLRGLEILLTCFHVLSIKIHEAPVALNTPECNQCPAFMIRFSFFVLLWACCAIIGRDCDILFLKHVKSHMTRNYSLSLR